MTASNDTDANIKTRIKAVANKTHVNKIIKQSIDELHGVKDVVQALTNDNTKNLRLNFNDKTLFVTYQRHERHM